MSPGWGPGAASSHPKEILTVDDDVRVRILAVDPQRKTLSLTMEEPEEDLSGELERMNENQDRELKSSSDHGHLFDAALPKGLSVASGISGPSVKTTPRTRPHPQ